MHHNLEQVSNLVQSGKVTYLLFDLDGTLYESSAGVEAQLRGAMCRQAALELGVELAAAMALMATYRNQYKSSIIGLRDHHGLDPMSFYEAVYNSLDVSRMMRRIGLVEALEALAASVPLGVFTNSNRSFTHRTLEFLGIAHVFERVVTVEDHGFIRKPNPEVYVRVFESLKRRPEEVIMFDDIASSLEAMSRLGSRGVLVGNGLRPAPFFVDLHTNLEHDGTPGYALASTHDISKFISDLNDTLARMVSRRGA